MNQKIRTTFQFRLLVFMISAIAFWIPLKSQVTGVDFYLKQVSEDSICARYSMYLIIKSGSAMNSTHRIQGQVQITVLTPANSTIVIDTSYMPLQGNLQYDGVIPGDWMLGIPEHIPTLPDYDFHPINFDPSPTKRYNDLHTGDTIRIFDFKVSNASCYYNVRLFDNTSDPGAYSGRSFNNGISIGSSKQIYNGISEYKLPYGYASKDIICVGDTSLLHPTNNGIWISSNPSVANVNSIGILTGLSIGMANLYFVDSLDGCIHEPIKVTIGSAHITAKDSICIGGKARFTTNAEGVWSSTNSNVASIDSLGIATGLSAGIANIIFTPTLVCVEADTAGPFIVHDTIERLSLSTDSLCIGELGFVLNQPSGYIFGVSDNTNLSITVSTSGLITPVQPGTSVLTYKDNNNCYNTIGPLTVLDKPVISFPNNIYSNDTIHLFPNIGTWQSSNDNVIHIIDAYKAIAILPGSATLTYEEENKCTSTASLNVIPAKIKISGIIYSDENNNGIFDTTELPLANATLHISELDLTLYTNSEGQYTFHLDTGQYNFIFHVSYGSWELNTKTISIFLDSSPTVLDVGFIPNPFASTKLLMNSGLLRCNQTAKLFTSVMNNGTTLFNGYVTTVLDPRTSNLVFDPQPISFDGTNVIWEINSLTPGNTFQATTSMHIPSMQGQMDSLFFNSFTQDSDFNITEEVAYAGSLRCSFDPNDKQSWPDRIGNENLTLKSEEITYTIRFQNTGNDTAFTVRVEDVLNENLDIETLKILDASHEVSTCMIDDRMCFLFENINLLDSLTDYAGSQGFVCFSVYALPSTEENTIVNNQAKIFFDLNEPITTNQVLNTIVSSMICDSISFFASICDGNPVITPYGTIEEPGIFEYLVKNTNGCDTIVHFQVDEITTQVPELLLEGGRLSVDAEGAFYKWFDCTSDTLIAITDYPYYSPQNYGVFKVEVEHLPCNLTSDCIHYFSTSTSEKNDFNTYVFPNPVSNFIQIVSDTKFTQYRIFNATISAVIDQSIFQNKIDMSAYENGLYIIELISDNGTKRVKVIKE